MPTKPKRPCRMMSCRNYAVEGNCYCKEHQRKMDQFYEKYQRGYKPSERYDKVWRLIRDKYIVEHPLCERCLENGIAKTAELVHHIIPIEKWFDTNPLERANKSPHIASNLMSLCWSCHGKIHGEMGDRWHKDSP